MAKPKGNHEPEPKPTTDKGIVLPSANDVPAPPQVDETPQGTEPRDPNPTRDPPLPNVAPAVD